ncbi:hypothetical protein [Bacillus xiapuensis]|uniref:hypothetical protein n=1 Tax=Bacillus xiapuensis TaxID=2014075 RepID=UPI000C239654|nr:hypothetical protein [Bacillus xiapuensis]
MTERNEELKKSIQRFYGLLKKYPDNANSAYDFNAFLRSFLKIQSKTPLPTIEIMTLIKETKPNVFQALRKMARKNLMLNILTELSTDRESAEKNLEKLLKI